MAMDAKQQKQLTIRIVAGIAIIGILAVVSYMIFFAGAPKKVDAKLGPSDNMAPATPVPVEAKPGGTIIIAPTQISFDPAQPAPNTAIFTIRAVGAPVGITNVTIPTTDADVLVVKSIDCPAPGAMIKAGESCSASVSWSGTRAVTSSITVKTVTNNSAGLPITGQQDVAVVGQGTGANGAAKTITGPLPGVTGSGSTLPSASPTGPEVGALPSQPGAPIVQPGAPSGQAQMRQSAVGMSPMAQARENYLSARRGGQWATSMPNQLMPAARSPYTSWNNIGVQGKTSSFPVDMARVITPDKPLPAVLTVSIDTRQTVTAVAMVDRDVYGNNGRTVVIPRGSKLIGRVGAASERVGIAWNQIIRPDGVRFVFEGESGDASGRGGIPGRINNRYLQRYGYSLLPTLVSAGITAGLGGQTTSTAGLTGNQQTQDARAVAAQIINQPLNQIAQDLAQKNGSVPVQITIPAGTRITVWSLGDLRLKPAGEPDDVKGQQNNAQQQSAAQPAAMGGGRGGFNPYAQQGQQGNENSQSQTQRQGAPQDNGASQGDQQLQVGRVDANGNYIAPGSTAPPPGPLVTNPGTTVIQQNSNGSRTTTTTFPQTNAPWAGK